MINCYYEFPSYPEYLMKYGNTVDFLHSWCKENCDDYYVLDVLGNKIRASFIKMEDAVAFKLRWY